MSDVVDTDFVLPPDTEARLEMLESEESDQRMVEE